MDNLQLPKVIYDEASFWQFVEAAKADSNGDSELQVQLLIARLIALEIADIIAFDEIFARLKGVAYQREVWSAAIIVCCGCSDDGFIDFRAWLIAQGRDIFDRVLSDPDSLVEYTSVLDEEGSNLPQLEMMDAVAMFAYENKTGNENLPDVDYVSQFSGYLKGCWLEKSDLPRLSAKFDE